MIRILDEVPEGVIGFEAAGKLTSDDYTRVLAPPLQAASAGPGKIRILLDFSGEFDGLEAGAVWQDLTVGVTKLGRLGTHRPWSPITNGCATGSTCSRGLSQERQDRSPRKAATPQ